MALGDGIRRNIASVDPLERALLRDALIELNNSRFFPGLRIPLPAGGVSWWFEQDNIHKSTHVHGGPEFIPWHRELVNRMEEMLRQINPLLSLHYWDWKQDPRIIPNANLGNGTTGTLNLFTPTFMGTGILASSLIGPPWLSGPGAGYYVPGAINYRSTNAFDTVNNNPADPPREVKRSVGSSFPNPVTIANENGILAAVGYPAMRGLLETQHNDMHGYVSMGGQHISFRDPFVFLLHSNVDRLFARWQTDPAHPERCIAATVYGTESGDAEINGNVEPWSTGNSIDQLGNPHVTRPWAAPDSQGIPHTYKHYSIVIPPDYDTNHPGVIAATGFQTLGGGISSNLAVGRNQNGRLEVFARGIDNAIWHSVQLAVPNSWSGWTTLGGNFFGTPVVVSNTDGRLEVFCRDNTNTLKHIWQTVPNNTNNLWSGWASMGVITGDPAVARNQNGSLEVFANINGYLAHIWQTTPVSTSPNTWSNWATFSIPILGSPAIGTNLDGRLEVFFRGQSTQIPGAQTPASQVMHIWQTAVNNGWSAPAPLGNIISLSDPVVGSNQNGRLEVFVKGMNSAVWHIWQTLANNGWATAWVSLGGFINSQPCVGKNADGRLEVFVRGADRAIWHSWQTAPNNSTSWSGFGSMGARTVGKPAVASNADGRLEVFARGVSQDVLHRWQTAPNNGWF